LYLADTNVVSEGRRNSRQAVAWLRSVRPEEVYLSALTLGEIMRGVTLRRKSDPQIAARLAEWLERLRRDHADRILPVTDRIALEWGRITELRPRGDIDGLIAATAIVHGLILVTRNVKDFEDTAVSLINPWSSA
jgi:predicted nucleic acid-binding protein